MKFDEWWETARGKPYCGDKDREREAYAAGLREAAGIADEIGFAAVNRTDAQNCCAEISEAISRRTNA